MVQAISDFASWLLGLVVNVILAFYDMQTDVACWIFDQVLDIVDVVIESADVGALQNYDLAGYLGSLPADLLNILGLVGVGDCAAIITAAVITRVILRFIPFI